MAVRPESIFCYSSKPDGMPVLKGQVSSRQFKGAHTALVVALANSETLALQLDPAEVARVDTDEVRVGWHGTDAVSLAA